MVTEARSAGEDAREGAGQDRVLTVPNGLSLIRLALIPVFVYVLFGRDNRAGAAWLMGGLGATDWVDGYIARRFNQVSTFGKVLDPTADRLLLIVGVACIIIDGSAPGWFSALVVAREVILGGALVVLTAMGMDRFDVSWFGKAGTFGLMFSFPAFLLGHSDFAGNAVFEVLGWVFGIPGLLFSYYAAATYLPIMKRSLRDGRARKARAT
ncbi:MAG: pgsA [Acidimicrobiia bacterium]|nr:pgsA [Acidimicrobiia bacterium]